jgi:hypothetical protein
MTPVWAPAIPPSHLSRLKKSRPTFLLIATLWPAQGGERGEGADGPWIKRTNQ